MNLPPIPEGAYDALTATIPAFAGAAEYPLAHARRRHPGLRANKKLPFVQIRRRDQDILLIYALDLPKPPQWLFTRLETLRHDPKISILVTVLGTKSVSPEKIACDIIRECLRCGIGVAIRTTRGLELVLAPKLRVVQRALSDDAVGHIPDWLITRLHNARGLSPTLRRAIDSFRDQYARFCARGNGGYDDECAILDGFARRLAQGDRRLFFPTDLLHNLRDFERSRTTPTKRDHFFHTFNNLFLGFVLLAESLPNRVPTASPDNLIRTNGTLLRQHPWESLWSLTCMFHDGGYIAEDFPSAVDHSLGLMGRFSNIEVGPIPDAVAKHITDAWDTEFATARKDLVELAHTLTRGWQPARFRAAADARLEEAIRNIYFNGTKCGHSLMSGLMLINRCDGDRAAQHQAFNKETALTACNVAALSMVFHDPHARSVFTQGEVPPITFELLPYAATLAFVDALQEDRRTIEKMRFPRRGALESLVVDAQLRTVTAKINLRRIKLESWPWKVAEFAEVLSWLSRDSAWRFHIEYLASVGGRTP